MSKFNTVGEIKEAAQMLDTAVVQWLNAAPPDYVQNKLNDARAMLQKGMELADAPLRIAIVGEFNSGKTLLLNALMDTTDLFPCLLQPTTGNVCETRVILRSEEKPAFIKSSNISFFNQFEIDNVLDYYLKDLKNQGIEGVPSKVGMNEIEKLEKFLCKKFVELKSITPKYAIISALEFLLSLRYNQDLVCREERVSLSLPVDLIPTALTLTARPDLNKGIQTIYGSMKEVYERGNREGKLDKVNSTNLRSVFPVVRRVVVEVSAWAAPFGITEKKSLNSLAFLDFPGLGAESSSARDSYLCMTEIKDAHAVLVLFNGSNPGTAGASVMATLFQRAGKLSSERTLVAVNRFDEFHPLPTDRTIDSYYQSAEQGTTVGFCNILIPAKNLLSSIKKLNLYVCSAMCYLFEEKARRPNWNFGSAQWFNDSKRQAAYTCYKRCLEDFQRIIKESSKTGVKDHEIMRNGLQRYLEGGGVVALRTDLVNFAMEKGEKLIKEDALKEIREAYLLLDQIAPALRANGEAGPINPEVSFAAQEFYRVLELAVADTLPGGASEYKKLKVKGADRDFTLWENIEEEIAAKIMSWPEWFAILNQGMVKPSSQRADKPQKKFGRYQNLKKQGCEVPAEFKAFDERFRTTAQSLTQQTLEGIGKAMLYSLQRFEQHGDYRAAIDHLQTMITTENLGNIPEALPLLDVWNPSKLAEEEIIPTVLERINDEVTAIENLSYPYDGSKPCFWNLALIIRIQVQLLKTYRDRLSRLVAASESEFESFYTNEVLRAEILPLVRSALNNPDFVGKVAVAEAGRSWESVGQVVRAAVENIKAQDGVPGASPVAMVTDMNVSQLEEEDDVSFEMPSSKPVTKPQSPSKPGTPVAKGLKDKDVKPATPGKPGSPTVKAVPGTAKGLQDKDVKPGTIPGKAVPATPASTAPTPKGLQDKDVPNYSPELVNDDEADDDGKAFEEW